MSNRFTRGRMLDKQAARKEPAGFVKIILMTILVLLSARSSFATTKGLSQIVTPDLQPEGDLSLSNGSKHDLFGYIVFTYTFHLWRGKIETVAVTKSVERVAGVK